MKSLVLKITFLLCLSVIFNMSAQSGQPKKTVKKTTVKKATVKKTTATKAVTTTDTTPNGISEGTLPTKEVPPPPVAPSPSTEVTGSDAPPLPVNRTGGMPVMTFDKKTINFGKIKTGERPTVTYNFTNTGNAPLDIDIVSGCDCTELEWTRATVQPGEKGFVKATFKSDKAEEEDHKKQLKKYVDIVLKQIHPKSGNVLNESLTFEVFIID